MDDMELSALYQAVSQMIVEQKHAEASLLEEKIAKLLPVSTTEGMVCRRGAVWSAIDAEDYVRAIRLGRQYIEEAWKTDISPEEQDVQTGFWCLMFDLMASAEEKQRVLVADPPKPA